MEQVKGLMSWLREVHGKKQSSRVVSLCLWWNLGKAQLEVSCAVYIQFLKQMESTSGKQKNLVLLIFGSAVLDRVDAWQLRRMNNHIIHSFINKTSFE